MKTYGRIFMKTYGRISMKPYGRAVGFVPDPRFPILSGASLVLGHEAAAHRRARARLGKGKEENTWKGEEEKGKGKKKKGKRKKKKGRRKKEEGR